MLQRYFAHTEETDAQLKALADVTVNLMFGVIKPLGDLITTLPGRAGAPGRTAGPSFELFDQTITCCRTARPPGRSSRSKKRSDSAT